MTRRSKPEAPGDASAASAAAASATASGVRYTVGPWFENAMPEPYERKSTDPLYRHLRIYTADPTVPRLEGAVALADVPYEPLQPGPAGRLLRIENLDADQGIHYRQADLDDPAALVRDGYAPSQTDPCFHQQMVYAVCSNVCAAFGSALGRTLQWGPAVGPVLKVFPHACCEANAYYDEVRGELRFGYYRSEMKPTDNTLPGGFVFTCLSHDVVAHEVTHALLDGLRAYFSRPSGPDVIAFHEGLADMVAVFQRFSYGDVVRNAIGAARGNLTLAHQLTELACQLGHTTAHKAAMRDAIDTDDKTNLPRQSYDPKLESHALGTVLLGAVFEAFIRIYTRKTARYIRLATGGSGVLPPGELSTDLREVLVERATALARQFLNICIRAIDYCPPVGLNFGDFLRALITADYDLVPDDTWDYRGALIDAFRRRGIYPRGVANLSEDALLWRPTRVTLPPIDGLSFAKLRFTGGPGSAVPRDERLRRAHALGEYISRPAHLEEFGLVASGDPRLDGDPVSLPCVQSIRSTRRVGPDGQLAFDLVAEVTQSREVCQGPERFTYHGGSTIILAPGGTVRFVILKNVVGAGRLERRQDYLRGAGRRFWHVKDGRHVPKEALFRMVHHKR